MEIDVYTPQGHSTYIGAAPLFAALLFSVADVYRVTCVKKRLRKHRGRFLPSTSMQ